MAVVSPDWLSDIYHKPVGCISLPSADPRVEDCKHKQKAIYAFRTWHLLFYRTNLPNHSFIAPATCFSAIKIESFNLINISLTYRQEN
jgi:hypothetical protein